MQPIRQELEDKGFTIFAVTTGSSADLEFLRAKGFRTLIDAQALSVRALGVQYIPHTFFIDAAGTIVKSSVGWGGEDSVNEFRAKVDELTTD